MGSQAAGVAQGVSHSHNDTIGVIAKAWRDWINSGQPVSAEMEKLIKLMWSDVKKQKEHSAPDEDGKKPGARKTAAPAKAPAKAAAPGSADPSPASAATTGKAPAPAAQLTNRPANAVGPAARQAGQRIAPRADDIDGTDLVRPAK
jgi:hypothetical protein